MLQIVHGPIMQVFIILICLLKVIIDCIIIQISYLPTQQSDKKLIMLLIQVNLYMYGIQELKNLFNNTLIIQQDYKMIQKEELKIFNLLL